ncbi:PAS domain-containing sensor histidine kinase [Parabacteroides sp. Marseille-P3160]|uniref:sensor histidine kinase n=1 Tax=Parabacteroides sp. Marseille-P3160 TaxID=1917887 RepID=UPI0009BA65A6|nr:ATP-binding protein [Parabacteroides sp. Marseille-P3160]
MRLRGWFWIWTILLLSILAAFSYYVFRGSSLLLFLGMEGVILLALVYLIFFYHRIIKPIYLIGSGMELLKEQDFSSRLRPVGQADADRIVDVFNRMMGQLKNERLRLREQNHFLDLLIKASPMGVIILNLDKEVLSLNAASYKMLGLASPEEAIGKPLTQITSPLAAELALIPLHESQTIRLSDANIYKCTHSSFVNQGFQHSFYLVESLTKEVSIAEKKAYEKVIRMISHEVNNTTAGITSTLDTLESGLTGMEQEKEVGGILRVLIERCYRLSRFVTDYADVVRIPEPQLTNVSLNNLVVSSKRFMETICRNRNIKLLTELSESDLQVQIDASLFEQVLLNIIKNAAESIDRNGTVTIRTFADPPSIQITDTGRGIDKDTAGKLFTPFFSTKPNGQGIGLIFIREVLQKHHCTFSLHTDAEGLTHFRIVF